MTGRILLDEHAAGYRDFIKADEFSFALCQKCIALMIALRVAAELRTLEDNAELRLANAHADFVIAAHSRSDKALSVRDANREIGVRLRADGFRTRLNQRQRCFADIARNPEFDHSSFKVAEKLDAEPVFARPRDCNFSDIDIFERLDAGLDQSDQRCVVFGAVERDVDMLVSVSQRHCADGVRNDVQLIGREIDDVLNLLHREVAGDRNNIRQSERR